MAEIGEATGRNTKEENVSEILNTLKPIIIAENVFGQFKFSLIDGKLHPPDYKMKTFSIVLGLASLFLFFFSSRLPTIYSASYNLIDIIDQLPSIVTTIQYFTSSFNTCFLLSTSSISLIQSFAKLDTMLRIKFIPDFYQKSRSRTNLFFLILLISHFTMVFVDFYTKQFVSFYQFVIGPIYFIQKLNILSFCIMIIMLETRLMILNRYLSTFVERNSKKISIKEIFPLKKKEKSDTMVLDYIGRASTNNTKLRDLAESYNKIGEVCSTINKVFNFQIFMSLLATFTFIIIVIWTSFYYYRTPEDHPGGLVNIAIWCFSTVNNVAVMSLTTDRLLSTRGKTRVLVNKLIMDYDLPRMMRVQAKAFMEVVEAWPLRICVYDMLSLDITLTLKFISMATTYLIIIIQISHFV